MRGTRSDFGYLCGRRFLLGVHRHTGRERHENGATVSSSPDQNSIWNSCCSSSSSRRSVLGP